MMQGVLPPPSGATVATATFMTNADFESVKHDPMLVLERATQFITLLEQQDRALQEENTLLQQQLRKETERVSFNPEQHATLVETASELELDHRELSQKYVDLEHINKMMHGVIDVLTADKQRLLDEVSGSKREHSELVAQYTKLQSELGDLEAEREAKEAQLKTQQEETDFKLSQLEEYSKRVAELTQKSIDLQDATEKIGSGRLALEAETTALEQSTQQQERTLSYLQNEVTNLDHAIKSKADEMVQLKKQMSASILELQLQITKAEEEMSRIRTTVANEKDLTGRQNLWLAKDLQTKTQELLLTRQEMTAENEELKTELAKLREKAQRLKSNVLVVEKRNQIRHDDLKRLESEDDYAKAAYSHRKDAAFSEMNEQAAVLAKLNSELQTSREELYIIKSKLCKQCRMSILHTQAVERK
jgi:chromosome segregation ATPase